MTSQLLCEKDAALFMAVSVAFLRKRRRLGLDPSFVRLGRAVRYEPRELEAFVQRHTVRRSAAV